MWEGRQVGNIRVKCGEAGWAGRCPKVEGCRGEGWDAEAPSRPALLLHLSTRTQLMAWGGSRTSAKVFAAAHDRCRPSCLYLVTCTGNTMALS